MVKKVKSKRSIAVSDSPHRYGNSHAIWDHTVLPATQQRWHSRRYPSRSWYSIKRPRRDARLSWPSWLITARDGIPARRRSPIPVVTVPTCVNFVHWRTPLTTTSRRQQNFKILLEFLASNMKTAWNSNKILKFLKFAIFYESLQWQKKFAQSKKFCRDSFSLLRQLCTVGYEIFYMADVNNFLLVN